MTVPVTVTVSVVPVNRQVPAWTSSGVLPPNNASDPMGPDRSPYGVSLVDFVTRFATTPERRAIAAGFMGYRAALHAAGLISGFQWLDGSFCEDVEKLEGRPPRDIDVVSFYRLPASASQRQLAASHREVFNKATVKSRYKVDAYIQSLGSLPELLVERSAYWYAAWSHRRNSVWKGFLQVDLDPASDLLAAAALAATQGQGFKP